MGKSYIRSTSVVDNFPLSQLFDLSDDFEGTLAWDKSGTGTPTLQHQTTIVNRGLNSLEMKTRTTGAAANDYVKAKKYFNFKVPSRKLFTCIFRHGEANNFCVIRFEFELWEKDLKHYTQIEIDVENTEIGYMDADGNNHVITGFVPRPVYPKWYSFELQFDMLTKCYQHIRIGSFYKSLANIPYFTAAAGADPFASIAIYFKQTLGTASSLFVDDVLLQSV